TTREGAVTAAPFCWRRRFDERLRDRAAPGDRRRPLPAVSRATSPLRPRRAGVQGARRRVVRPGVAAVAAVAVVLLLSACGGGGDATATIGATGGPTSSTAKVLFLQNCGACHALDAAGTSGTFGGDLVKLRPSRSAVRRAIDDGPGTMPAAIL